jgi:hypothetical protein
MTYSISNPVTVPFDFAAACATPGWREALTWPFSPIDYDTQHRHISLQLIRLAEGLEEDDRMAVMAMLGLLLITILPALEAAQCAELESANAFQFIGGPPELEFLRGNRPMPAPQRIIPMEEYEGPRFPIIRSILETLKWTGYGRLLPALLAPKSVVITTTPAQLAWAKSNRINARFVPAWTLLQRARRNARPAPADRVNALSASVADIVVREAHLNESTILVRLRQLVSAQAAHLLAFSISDVESLKQIRLPKAIMSGTGGYYPSRIVGLEVKRRGGHVTRFEHGGSSGFTDAESFAVVEAVGTSCFVSTTPRKAELIRKLGIDSLSPLFSDIEVAGATGDPFFHSTITRSLPPNAGPLRVCYACTFLTGYRKTIADVMTDVVYMDWQLRLADMLSRLPVAYVTKPHPEGIASHAMLAEIAPVNLQRFEDMMDWADVFVFDHMGSTSFWKALCTDRPVVYIDIGYGTFSPAALPLIERRCRVVRTTLGSDNRPILDADVLAAAVLDTTAPRIDEIRAVFLGS